MILASSPQQHARRYTPCASTASICLNPAAIPSSIPEPAAPSRASFDTHTCVIRNVVAPCASNSSCVSTLYRPQFITVRLSCSTVAIDTHTKYGTCAKATQR